MNIFVGIDPSVNSTGVCIIKSNEESSSCKFYIIKDGKLTKKESKAEDSVLDIFQYLQYDKKDTSNKVENYRILEQNKTYNMISICNVLKEIINKNYSNEVFNLYICQEGISYGSSVRTKSVFDLAGLNYLLRNTFINNPICTELIIAAPAEIKKFATGKGNASKDMMIGVFQGIYPDLMVLPKCDDICDAYFMANYAKYLYESGKI